jgi:hypothetical protein
MKNYKNDEINIAKLWNGLQLSVIVQNRLLRKTYYGYSAKEAIIDFNKIYKYGNIS